MQDFGLACNRVPVVLIGDMPEDAHSRLGQNVRRLRRERGVTRERLAVAAAVSVRTLASIEGGSGNPQFGILAAIAKALGVSVSDLTADAVEVA